MCSVAAMLRPGYKVCFYGFWWDKRGVIIFEHNKNTPPESYFGEAFLFDGSFRIVFLDANETN